MIDYDPHQWLKHFFDIRGSMVRQICFRVAACVAWSVVVVYFHKRVAPVSISDKGHLIIGIALGLLLVFRTNASYDRFWEARKLWGGYVNESRNLARACKVYLRDAPDLLRPIIGWTILYTQASLSRLRDVRELGAISTFLPANEFEEVRRAPHRPLAIAVRISSLLNEARRRGIISDIVQTNIDQNVQLLIDYFGGCERIHRTPLPFVYVIHLRRALILYYITLPFALLDSFGWLTIPANLLLAYITFGIEEIGVEIEDPFGQDDNDLPLERICAVIERDLLTFLPPESAAKP